MLPGELGKLMAEMLKDESAEMDALGKRIAANVIMEVIGPWLPEERRQKQTIKSEPFTDPEARRFGKERMEFGKYAGRQIDEVPLDYLEWLVEQNRSFCRNVDRYLRSPRIKQETAHPQN